MPRRPAAVLLLAIACGHAPLERLHGVVVSYNRGCDEGCDDVRDGDVITHIDGERVLHGEDLDGLADGRAHELELQVWRTGEARAVRIVASGRQPPFHGASTAELYRAPMWARGTLFGRASPAIAFADPDGNVVDGQSLVGAKHLLVYFDDEVASTTFMNVLQRAQEDLLAVGVRVGMVLTKPRTWEWPVGDWSLPHWQARHSIHVGGRPWPAVPIHHRVAGRDRGIDPRLLLMGLRGSPSIVILDEHGIVRWHTDGIYDATDLAADIPDASQATIISAVLFALRDL